MSPESWSWITATASITGCWLLGRSPRVGWLFGIPLELLWITAGVETRRWGDCVMAAFFLAMNAHHLWRWHGTRFEPARKMAKAVGE